MSALVPVPSANPLVLPTRVLTTPPGYVTIRMRLLVESATTIAPSDGITATPAGHPKLADVPVPSAKAWVPLPARVLTTPLGETTRMRLLSRSETTKAPLEGMTATPRGYLKLAAVPVPSAKAALPLPANVLAAPPVPQLADAAAVPATASPIACGDATPCASPAAPHSSTAAYEAGAAHLTHALALKATLPPAGSAAGAPEPATVR